MGEDANITKLLGVEYIKGFPVDEIGLHSVNTTTKHFPGGGGPVENGEYSHYEWGKNQIYPDDNLDYHLISSQVAVDAGTHQTMPYYSRPINTKWEEVAFASVKVLIADLLKKQMGLDDIVVTKWGVFTTRYWGLQNETELERTRRAVEAGCDMFGDES